MDIFLFVIGIVFLFYNLKVNPPALIKKIFSLLYFLLFFEILSFMTIKYILHNNEEKRDQVRSVLEQKKFKSKFVSYIKSDLRSDYKLNKYSKKVNDHGYRSGGKKNLKNKFTIMCVGGSTTFGTGVHDSLDSYPALPEKILNEKGFDVNVINAGVPYHTSLDVLMRFITKGFYSKPYMLLIHTGGNDTGPLNSPSNYLPDYSHWRDVGTYNLDNLFKKIWNEYPFSSIRLFLLFILKPGQATKVAEQYSFPIQELLSKTPINRNRTSGLENYLHSLVLLSKKNNIIPVTILFNMDHKRENSLSKKYFKGEELKYAINRKKKSNTLHNSIMDSISISNEIRVIYFNEFKPDTNSSWLDHCHLDNKGNFDKAIFFY